MENQVTPDIEITFVNQSNNMKDGNVVIFQKNIAAYADQIAVAWHVIQSQGQGWTHQFNFSPEVQIGIQDVWGNVSTPQKTEKGKKWIVVKGMHGDTLFPESDASNPEEIEIRNCLPVGAINALVYRNEKLVGIKTGILPQQKCTFRFKPTIWVGMVTDSITEGKLMNNAVLANIHTEISLQGITKARLIMKGGGNVPTQFVLEPSV